MTKPKLTNPYTKGSLPELYYRLYLMFVGSQVATAAELSRKIQKNLRHKIEAEKRGLKQAQPNKRELFRGMIKTKQCDEPTSSHSASLVAIEKQKAFREFTSTFQEVNLMTTANCSGSLLWEWQPLSLVFIQEDQEMSG